MLIRLGRPLRPPRLEPWQRNLYTIVGAQTIGILGFGISIPFLPYYIQELGVTDLDQVAFWVGLINSVAPISLVLASPVWGMLADRFGRKPMLVRAMLAAGLMLTLMSVARSVPQLAALRIIQGTLTGTVPAATTLVASSTPRERAGFALGLLQTAIFTGNSLGPFVGGLVGAYLGYRMAFLAAGLLLASAGVVVLLLVREDFPATARTRQAGGLGLSVRTITRQPLLLTMLALLMLNNVGNTVTTPVLPLFVQTLVGDLKGASRATGFIMAAAAAANAVGAVGMGRTADRIGRRRALLTCLAVGCLVYFPQMLTRHPAQLLVLRVVTGLAMGAVVPIANALIAERTPRDRQGGVYGISASLNSLGRALGPMLGTVVVTHWWVGGVFPVTGILLGLGALMVALATRRGGRL